ncbi:MAG: hypothetical protein GEV03_19790 [Streptosporangiales bacterium]|nr:hypothetical protein [Streptosporangiales bacterium]
MPRRSRPAIALALLGGFAFAPMAATEAGAAVVQRPDARAVLIGVPGLRWQEIDPDVTPELWRLTERGSVASMSVRTAAGRTCPVDGWLTVSAGERATLVDGSCGLPPVPIRSGGGATVRGFAKLRDDNAATGYGARIGLLGSAVAAEGACVSAVGPGAAVAAADGEGRVSAYAERLDTTSADAWRECPLTVVEIDDIFDAAGVDVPLREDRRAAAVRRVDRQVARVLDGLPDGTTVLVAGVSDSSPKPNLHVAIAAGPAPDGGRYDATYLTAASARRGGLVTLTDVTATALQAVGADVPSGAPTTAWRPGEPCTGSVSEAVSRLADDNVAANAVTRLLPLFHPALAALQVLVYGLAVAALLRRGDGPRRRVRVLAATRYVALAGGAVPVATFLANLVPWWRGDHPLLALLASVVLADVLVLGVALFGPWRRHLLGPVTVIAGATTLCLAVDVMTGSHLQINSLTGYTALVAGRFYGFANIGFAVFATSSLLAAAALAHVLIATGRRRLAVAGVVAIGAAVVAVDGWPEWGSDFGGVIALVPAFAMTALMVAGQRVSARRFALLLMAGIVVVAAVAFVDSLRPAESRSHLGGFWHQLFAGAAGPVVLRKIVTLFNTTGNWQTTLIAALAVFGAIFVLARPVQRRAAALQLVYRRAPTVRAGLAGTLVIMLLGSAVNDSGVAIPAFTLVLMVPLMLALCVRALELEERDPPRSMSWDRFVRFGPPAT